MSKKSKLNFTVFMRLLSYWRSYKWLFFLSIVTTFLLAFPGPIRPKLIGNMVDQYIVKGEDANQLLWWTLFIVGLLVFEAILRFLSSYYSNLFAQSIIRDLRKDLMKHILTFRIQYFDKTPVGTMVTRLVSDLEAITQVFSSGMIAIAGELVALIFSISLMFYTNWKLTLLVLIPIPILIFATRVFARVIRKSYQQEAEQVNKLNVFVQERITGMSLVQLFNRQEKEYKKFQEINKGHRQAHIKAIWANSIFFPVVEVLSSISIACLLVFGALSVQGKMPAEINGQFGEIVAFILWVHMLYRPIRMLADKFNILQRGTVRAERVFKVLDHEENIQNKGDKTDCNFNGAIRFENMFFAYNNEEWVLKDINLTIEPGSTVAFVGATGAGKSSLVNLLGRFYEHQKGEIYIGDGKLTDIELNFLRKNIAIVLQDVFLFSGTILNNITLGDPEISKEQVIEASKAVGAHSFIEKLPNQYEFEVGERGGVLSTGQRQLISFIRAYVYDPHILILDEATSSVDNESEELIQKATIELTKGRTSIVIAHRLSTIKNADKIVVLDKGEIKEQGTHAELLNLGGYYKTLHEMQFSEE
ncbi:MAG TPA: ABC transporter ATP-binding protein [Crocinitomicaceae bacterium]|nr:ABC transporter ATP-binding protein [Crocinitomicaceae bacterium]